MENHLVRVHQGEQHKKPQIYFLRLFLLRPLEGREEPNEAPERLKIVQWTILAKGRDGALE